MLGRRYDRRLRSTFAVLRVVVRFARVQTLDATVAMPDARRQKANRDA